MKCCTQGPKNKGDGKQAPHPGCSGIKHMVKMLACCLAPLGMILLLQQTGYGGAANYLALLLCPLMHFFMMRGMSHKEKDGSTEEQSGKVV